MSEGNRRRKPSKPEEEIAKNTHFILRNAQQAILPWVAAADEGSSWSHWQSGIGAFSKPPETEY